MDSGELLNLDNNLVLKEYRHYHTSHSCFKVLMILNKKSKQRKYYEKFAFFDIVFAFYF